MREKKQHFSVIIPAYNEERRIGRTLLSVDSYLSRQGCSSEIVVVNDGSNDTTATVISHFKETIHNLIMIDNMKNRCKGWPSDKDVSCGLSAG